MEVNRKHHRDGSSYPIDSKVQGFGAHLGGWCFSGRVFVLLFLFLAALINNISAFRVAQANLCRILIGDHFSEKGFAPGHVAQVIELSVNKN